MKGKDIIIKLVINQFGNDSIYLSTFLYLSHFL
jgi:hypothetical protein